MLKVWVNDTFKGHYPVGTAAVVIAKTAKMAAKCLSEELAEENLDPVDAEDMQLMEFKDKTVIVLCNGNY